MLREHYIYCYFRPCGEPCYIGMGRRDRWKQHLKKSCNPHLTNIIAQADGEIPHVKLCVGLTRQQAVEYEISWIAAIGRQPNGPLVNLTDGGEGLKGADAETRAKMRAAKVGFVPWNVGVPRSEETKKKLRAANLGKKQSEETRAKLAAILSRPDVRLKRKIAGQAKAKPKLARSKMGSVEWREKLRLAHLGKVKSPEAIEKQRAKMIGRKHSAATLQKMSEIQKVVQKGKRLSAEHRAKIGEAGRGRKRSPETIEKMRAAQRLRAQNSIMFTHETKQKAYSRSREIADERAASVAPVVMEIQSEGITGIQAISNELNRRGVPTVTGCKNWQYSQVQSLLKRINERKEYILNNVEHHTRRISVSGI